jgi:hypothetical protein
MLFLVLSNCQKSLVELVMWGGIKDAGLDAWEALKHPIETGKAIYSEAVIYVHDYPRP